MKKIFLLLVLCLFGQFVLADSIKVGYFNVPPHSYVVDGIPVGASVDYLTEHANIMGYEIEWVGPLPFPRLMSELEAGRIDAAMLLSKNAEREKFLTYADEPYIFAQTTLALPANASINEIASSNDISGMKIGFLADAVLPDFIEANKDSINMDLVSSSTWLQQGLQKLQASRIDAVLAMNQYSLMYETAKLGMTGKVKMLPIPGDINRMYVAFSKQAPSSNDYLQSFNAAVVQINTPYDTYVHRVIGE